MRQMWQGTGLFVLRVYNWSWTFLNCQYDIWYARWHLNWMVWVVLLVPLTISTWHTQFHENHMPQHLMPPHHRVEHSDYSGCMLQHIVAMNNIFMLFFHPWIFKFAYDWCMGQRARFGLIMFIRLSRGYIQLRWPTFTTNSNTSGYWSVQIEKNSNYVNTISQSHD